MSEHVTGSKVEVSTVIKCSRIKDVISVKECHDEDGEKYWEVTTPNNEDGRLLVIDGGNKEYQIFIGRDVDKESLIDVL